jgi:hypothetical protein
MAAIRQLLLIFQTHEDTMRVTTFTQLFTITLISALALGLTACTPPNYKPAHHTSAYDCKRLQGRGVITLEQERACRMGQPYDLKSVRSSPQQTQ